MMAPPPLSMGGGGQQQQSHISTARRSRLLMTFLAGIALVVLLFAGGGGSKDGGKSVDRGSTATTSTPAVLATSTPSSSSSSPRVPVTIFVMSRCPDAQFCETFLQPILEPLKGVVRLRAEYIVREEEEEATTPTKKKLTCMHGEQECAGNRQQLCLQKRLDGRIAAGKISADATVDVLLKFLTCGWRRPSEIGSEAGARSCLAEVGWTKAEDQDDVLACAKGPEGEALMAASHAATKAAGATNSCTINVSGKRRCVRDGGAFRECEGGSEPADFKRTVCEALKAAGGGTAAAVCK